MGLKKPGERNGAYKARLVLVDVPNERQERWRLLLQETKVEHLDLGRTVIMEESFYIITGEFKCGRQRD